MKSYREKVFETVQFLQKRLKQTPQMGLLTGTGLKGAVDAIHVAQEIEYGEIPHFPISTVISHTGKLLAGRLNGRQMLIMQGRFHLYEDYTPLEVTYPVRVMHQLGIKTLILTNAAGGLDTSFNKGDIMVIRDHINLTGANPLIGLSGNIWGERFPDMTAAYPADLAAAALDIGKQENIAMRSGVYAGLKGPSLETPAETRFLRTIGADAVGFSTVHETITAVQAGIKVLGLSIITNINDPERPVRTTADEVIAVATRATPKLARIVQAVIAQID
jgi:purine-nucleoside phosphorylase